jgi:uncharacterized protein with GYD domain
MASYLVLGNYTQQGMQMIRAAPARIDTAREVMDKVGAKLVAWFFTLGRYDFVILVEAPSPDVIAKLMLAIGSHGNIRTETLQAFNQQEFHQIVTDLPY